MSQRREARRWQGLQGPRWARSVGLTRGLGRASWVVLAGLSAGCPDTAGVFGAYLDRSDPLRVAPVAGECSGPIDLSGRYLLGASVIIGPDKPLRFAVLAEVADGAISFTLQALAFPGNAAGIAAGTPVGEVFGASSPLDAVEGSFALDFGTIVVPGSANALLPDVEVTAAFVMEGCTSTASFACGAITGDVILPVALPLAGSTWAIAAWGEGFDAGELELEVGCPAP